MVKKLSVILMLIIMIITPVLLTGCVPTGGGGGNTGGGDTGGGDTGGGEIPTDPVIQPKLADYFDGLKITYNPDLSGDLGDAADNNGNGISDKEDYLIDVMTQINALSREVIIRLMAHYGLGVAASGYRLYYTVNGEEVFEDIYLGGYVPFDAEPATFGGTYAYAHKDAVRKNFYGNGPALYLPWNWTINEGLYSASSYINDYVLQHSDNLEIAIYMIKLGKNIHIVGSDDYNEYMSIITGDKSGVKENFARQVPYVGMLEDEMQKLQTFILKVMIGDSILNYDKNFFNDINSNGRFDAEQFYDSNDNGTYDAGEPFNDLNNNQVFDTGVTSGAYDTMVLYFKNYTNTVISIMSIISANTTRYPKIASLQYQDFTMEQVESNLDEIFTIPTGYQAYKSLIFMNSQTINLESIWLAFESTRTFNLQITARYYKAGQGIVFDDVLTTLLVNAGAWDLFENSNDYEINIEQILQSYDIAENSLQPFINNTESYDTSIVLNSQAPQADYFTLEKASDGTTTLAKYADNSTDFFEIIFHASPLISDTNTSPILFRFGFVDIYFSEVE